jgi:flagellin
VSGSINTNVGAMVALRNLQNTNNDLSATQKRISTGLNVADAYDDGASYAVAQGLRSDISALGAVNERLAVGKGMIDVAVKAGESISETMGSLRNVLLKLADEAVTGEARTNYQTEFTALKDDIKAFISSADYNGVNLIKASAADQKIISGISGAATEVITVNAADLDAGIVTELGAVPTTAAAAQTLLGAGFKDASNKLNATLNTLGADARRISNQIKFNNARADATNTGLGAIVDADLAKESAKLQSLQTKQQLGVQSLSIADQSPQVLLGLFR